jgi:hypothetical protein
MACKTNALTVSQVELHPLSMHHGEKTSSLACAFAKSLLPATGKNILISSAYKRCEVTQHMKETSFNNKIKSKGPK